MTQKEIDLLQSPVFWGVIVSMIAPILAVFHVTIDQTAAVNYGVSVAGGVIALVAHMRGTPKITSLAGLVTKSSKTKAVAQAQKPAVTGSVSPNAPAGGSNA